MPPDRDVDHLAVQRNAHRLGGVATVPLGLTAADAEPAMVRVEAPDEERAILADGGRVARSRADRPNVGEARDPSRSCGRRARRAKTERPVAGRVDATAVCERVTISASMMGGSWLTVEHQRKGSRQSHIDDGRVRRQEGRVDGGRSCQLVNLPAMQRLTVLLSTGLRPCPPLCVGFTDRVAPGEDLAIVGQHAARVAARQDLANASERGLERRERVAVLEVAKAELAVRIAAGRPDPSIACGMPGGLEGWPRGGRDSPVSASACSKPVASSTTLASPASLTSVACAAKTTFLGEPSSRIGRASSAGDPSPNWPRACVPEANNLLCPPARQAVSSRGHHSRGSADLVPRRGERSRPSCRPSP